MMHVNQTYVQITERIYLYKRNDSQNPSLWFQNPTRSGTGKSHFASVVHTNNSGAWFRFGKCRKQFPCTTVLTRKPTTILFFGRWHVNAKDRFVINNLAINPYNTKSYWNKNVEFKTIRQNTSHGNKTEDKIGNQGKAKEEEEDHLPGVVMTSGKWQT